MIMNKVWYNFGNSFKVKFRRHYCSKCGGKLIIVKHRKVVDQQSEEAKYYNFSAGVDGGVMFGPCEFIHDIFYCPFCSSNIEFVTQFNQEDIDIIIKKVEKYFYKKGKPISIKKQFEKQDGTLETKINISEQVKYLCLSVDDGKQTTVYKIPISRKNAWERPYYFAISKKKLINIIQSKTNCQLPTD